MSAVGRFDNKLNASRSCGRVRGKRSSNREEVCWHRRPDPHIPARRNRHQPCPQSILERQRFRSGSRPAGFDGE
jgi:hypothetical protein